MDHQPEQRKRGPTVPGRRQDRSGKEQVAFILRLALILGMVSAYAVGFSPLYRLTGSGMWAALAILPVIAAAWFWGLRPALLAALLCSLLSGLLVSLVQSSHWGVVGQALLVSLAVYLPAGAVVGRLHDLGERLRDQISERKQVEEALLKRTHVLGERVKELTCLYGMGKLMQRPGTSLAEILRGTVELMPPAWQYPEGTCARVVLEGQESRTADYEETIWKQTSDIMVHGKPVGTVEVCYLEERPESDEGSFLKEERSLIDAVAERLGRITERKRAEERLRESEELYRTLVETSPDAISLSDLETTILVSNQRSAALFGFETVEEITGKRSTDFFAPEDRQRAMDNARRTIEEGIVRGVEYTFVRKDGTRFPGELSASLIVDAQGKPKAFMALIRDITERKRAEDALRESEVKWRTLALTAPAIILTIDRDSIIQYLNRAVGEYTPEQAVGTSAYDYVSPDQRETMRRSIEQVLETGQPGSYEILGAGPQGPSTAWYETHLGPVLYNDQVTAVTLVSTDITERKRAEEALRDEKAPMDALMDNITDSIYFKDRQCCLTRINRKMMRDLNLDEMSQAIGKTDVDLFGEEFGRKTLAEDQRIMATGEPIIGLIESRQLDDGQINWTLTTKVPLRDASGQIVGLAGITREINELMRAEQSLRESEEKYRNVVERANDGILIIQEAIVRYANPRLAEMWGATLQELIGTPFADHVHPDELPKVVDRYKRRMAGEDVTPIYGTVLRRNDGTKLYAELNAGIVTYQGNPADLVIVRDITERKRAQEQRRRYAAELERANKELRDFTYIVSHDLRAPLINLKGFTGELRQACVVVRDVMKIASPYLGEEQRQALTTTLQEYVPEALEFIDASTTRMDQLIRALLKLSRVGRRDLNLTPIDMDALVEETLQTLAHQIEEGQVQVTVGPLPQVVADRTSMEQIMGNLLSNAVNYLDRDRPGEIEISGERGREETTFRVRDNGRGIAKDDMDKVFAPFRRAGRQDRPGEGMGLAYVRALIRRHGGDIWCEAELGVGSTFVFTISNQLEKGGDHE